jgi:AbrB family looped-hinge helix DNA binding protein
MRINSKGQVTIPQALRKKTGLLPHSEVEFELDGKAVRIKRARRRSKRAVQPVRQKSQRDDWPEFIAQMRGKGDIKMTTDEIIALTRGE